RTIGALVAGLALFSATTGVLLLAPDLPAALTPAIASAAPPPPSPLALDRAVAAARAKFPSARLRDIRLPPADRIEINLDAPERHPRAVHTVSIRTSDGTVLKAVSALDNPVLWMKILPLHTGEAMPLIGPALLLTEAAALLFLIQAGLRLWLASRRKDPR
ncbi:MAG TPA: PepSY domain-containing protein, partial [Novosphingobium sp.]